MTLTTIPTRMLVLLGVTIAAAAAFLVLRPVLLSSSDGGTSPGVATSGAVKTSPATAPNPTRAGTKSSTKPELRVVAKDPKLLPDLPTQLAQKLRYSRVVVVSVYAGSSAGDRAMVAEARSGARAVGAGFVAVNVLRERNARELHPFIGTVSPPLLLVVRRPGKVVSRFQGTIDAFLVAQAARDAGARK